MQIAVYYEKLQIILDFWLTVNAASDAKIDVVETSASGTTVAGSGEVAEVNVNPGASNTSVTTNHTEITVAEGAGTVTSNNGSLSAGQSGTTDNKGALQANGTNASNTSKPSKDSSSDSGNKRPSRPSDVSDRVAVTDENGRTIGSFETGTVLTINPNNGSRTYTVTVGSGTIIQTPTREGYTFNGWSVSGTTITAQWTKNGDTPALIDVRDSEGRPIGAYVAGTQLTVDPANEKDEPYIFTVGIGNKVITVPTREGYRFNRWLPVGNTVTADWRKKPSEMTPVMRDDGKTIIGEFEIGATLTINPNNGENSYTVIVEPGLEIRTPVKTGFYFVSWLRDPLTTLTAQWSETSVEVGSVECSEGHHIGNYPIGTVLTVDPDNGEQPYTVTVVKQTVIPHPVKEGYDFDRWEPIGTSIKALWTEKQADMTEVKCSDGHTVGNFEVGVTLTIDPANDKDAPYTVVVAPGLVITHPAREGYTFLTWKRDPLTTLTATWEKKAPGEVVVKDSAGREIGTFKVGDVLTVNYNNGTETSTITVAANTKIPVPTKEGHTFTGWEVIGTTVTAQWRAEGEKELVSAATSIYDGKNTAPILMDEEYTEEATGDHYAARTYNQILRAVGDFRQDIAMVNGGINYKTVQMQMEDTPELQAERLTNAGDKAPVLFQGSIDAVEAEYAIIVGTLGHSEMIQGLVDSGKLTGTSVISGKWEAFTIQTVDNPTADIKKALVVAGSDARGTIYGLYSISEAIGVSPWYWMSDVPVETKNTIAYSTDITDDGPDVKYRGIFLNDEDISILHWASKQFPNDNPQLSGQKKTAPGISYYRHVFELMLRLRCNLLWPAMHEDSIAFNAAVDEDGIPLNSKEASKYGIVCGASHCDILLRSNTGEWEKWCDEHQAEYGFEKNTSASGQQNPYAKYYDFSIYKDQPKNAVMEYWRERLEKNKDYESILTIGMRGVHDGQFTFANYAGYGYPNAGTSSRTDFMKKILAAQRELIAEIYGSADAVPQVFIPYKEVADYYNAGLNETFQNEYSDVTLMWAEDNYGYIRQTPNAQEKNRDGGAGLYYHASYSGTPTSYLWLNSIQLSLMCEQLQHAYNGGMRTQWILNVGDIKPGDQSLECYAKLAWDTAQFEKENGVSEFLTEIVERDYGLSGNTLAKAVDAMVEYNQLIGTKKPEYYTIQDNRFNFSPTSNGDEALLWLERCQKVVDDLTDVNNALSAEKKIAFYEQIYYHALSVLDTAQEYIYYWKAQQAAEQGRVGSLDVYINLSKAAAAQIRARVDTYNQINGTKWTGGDPNFYTGKYNKGEPITGFMTWQHVRMDGSPLNRNHDIIRDNEYPSISADRLAVLNGIGAAAEGSATAGNATLNFNSLYTDEQHYFDVFSQQKGQVDWTAECSEAWIQLSAKSGATATEQRVIVTIDWAKATAATQTGTIKIYSGKSTTGDPAATFTVNAVNATSQLTGSTKGYQEANGYVMIEAEAYSLNTAGSDGSTWKLVKSNAQRGDTMKADDNTAKSTGTSGAKLTYQVYFENAGTYTGYLYRVPTLNEGAGNTVQVAIGVGTATPTVLSGQREWQEESASNYNIPYKTWGRNVMRQCEPLKFELTVAQGWNEITLYRVDSSVVVDRIAIQTATDPLRPSLFGDAILAVSDDSNGDVGKIVLDRSLLGPVTSPNNLDSPYTSKVAALPEEMGNAIIRSDMVLTVDDGETSYDGQSNVTTATSSELRVATVSVVNGTLKVTPVSPGVTSVEVTATEGGKEISFTITVTVNPKSVDGENLVYKLKDDGTIVIDPHDIFASKHPAASKMPGNTAYWGMNGIGVQALPDSGTSWTATTVEGLADAPKMTFQIDAGDGATFKLYVNTSNPDGSADSFHVFVDEAYKYANTDSGMNIGTAGAAPETWFSKKSGGDIVLTAGKHSITIVPREDGFCLNQIALVKSGSDAPTGTTLYTASQFSELGLATEIAPTVSLSLDKSSLTMRMGEDAQTITATASATNSETVTISAESSDSNTATVTVKDNVITVTAVKEGNAMITVKANATGCNEVTQTVAVVVSPSDTGEGKAYLETDEAIVVDVADALKKMSYADYENKTKGSIDFEWTLLQDGKSVQLLPECPTSGTKTGHQWMDTAKLTSEAPSLTFKVYAENAGDYYFSFFSASPNTSTDSFHISVNSAYKNHTGDKTFGPDKSKGDVSGEKWFTCQQTVSLVKGENTITIYEREAGTVLRQLMFSTTKPENLAGTQEWKTSTLGDIPDTGTRAKKSVTTSSKKSEPQQYEMTVGQTLALSDLMEVTALSAENTEAMYSVEVQSSDPEIVDAERSKDGTITLIGVAVGTVKITVTLTGDDDEETERVFSVTVTAASESQEDNEDQKDEGEYTDSEKRLTEHSEKDNSSAQEDFLVGENAEEE